MGVRSRMVSALGLAHVVGVFAACSPSAAQLSQAKGEGSLGAQNLPSKLDILVMVDNSSSMADKQATLAKSIPGLIRRFATPRCVDESGTPTGQFADESSGACANGKAEMRPIDDIHLGVVSSSLGSRGSDVCGINEAGRHNDDGARLINRSAAPDAANGFLSWNRGAGGTSAFEAAASDLISSVGQDGCGIEAQLESVYRFLIQPDPYAKVSLSGDPVSCQGLDGKGGAFCTAAIEGYDDEVLRQRAMFLRPDSLVAVVVLSDEDDASLDPTSVGGAGWVFMNRTFPGSPILRTVGGLSTANGGTTAALPTTACALDPASSECKSCAFADDPGSTAISSDANCNRAPHFYGGDDDSLNTRFYDMRQRYGVDPRFPLSRYVNGFTSSKVPDRSTEHDSLGNYIGTGACTNPLFAASLPTDSSGGPASLCDLPLGTRTPDQVFVVVIGGAPPALVHQTDSDGSLNDAAWRKLLGNDPASFDRFGIDPHMVQSVVPRSGLALASVGDPIHGGEWDTNKVDLQYACTFTLPKSVRCAEGDVSCDCDGVKGSTLCDAADPREQVRGKAYPTLREFEFAHALGRQATIGTLCVDSLIDPASSEFGYAPTLSLFADRVKESRSE